MLEIGPRIIVALDFDHIDPVRLFVKKLLPAQCRLKIGSILFTRYGPALIRELMLEGFDVFLDLKYHDIPQTVAASCVAAAELGVWMMNMHIASGQAAMCAAKAALDKEGYPGLLIGVTVLTSLDEQDLKDLRYVDCLSQVVLHRARLAQACGLSGVVCSPAEASLLRETCGPAFRLVTPGIRWEEALQTGSEDQKRTLSPAAAVRNGASYLVIGRPITQAADPLPVLQQVIDSMQNRCE